MRTVKFDVANVAGLQHAVLALKLFCKGPVTFVRTGQMERPILTV